MNGEIETIEQIEVTNKLLVDMVKNQKESSKSLFRIFIVTVCCFTVLLVSLVIGFFYYESQFEVTDKVTTKTITQEVSGSDSAINNVEVDQYNDNAVHNQK